MSETGWSVHATAKDFTVWKRDDIFNVTDGRVPSGDGGYCRLDSMLALKGLSPADLHVCAGYERLARAEPAEAYGGRNNWHGSFLLDGDWKTVDEGYGAKFFDSPQAARSGAAAVLDTVLGQRTNFVRAAEVEQPALRYCC
jgi:hypothetical protein